MAADNPLTEQDIRSQLNRLLESKEFANSARLKDFLSYIVDEALAGRAGRIKGVTIAQSVFGADQSFDPETNSIVRVEAGRLRRRLGEYYAGAGRHDPIRIDVPKGAYAPEFRPGPGRIEPPAPRVATAPDDQRQGPRWQPLTLAAALVAILLGWFLLLRDGQTPDGVQTPLGGTSVSQTTESTILFDQAFGVLMPPEDAARMDAAQRLFERVIELSPNFSGGYGGKSLTHSMKVLFIKSTDRSQDLDQALSLGRRAVELDDESALAFSALAFAYALTPDEGRTLENARRVLTATHRDPNASAMAALAMLVADHPGEAFDLVSRALHDNPEAPRTPYLNILAIAHYVRGDLERAAQALEENIARGGPTGPHTDVFLAATYAGLGRDFEAEAVVEKLQRTAPDYPVEPWLANFLKSDDALAQTMDRLRASGLPAVSEP
jgi:tetratricopeptide (TPR) repeat protein